MGDGASQPDDFVGVVMFCKNVVYNRCSHDDDVLMMQ